MPPSEPFDVLVVEDDADTRANLRDILELDDCHVETAGSVAEALARSDWPRFCAIILDRRLPDGSAETVLPRLREVAPDAAVLIVTGYRDLEGAVACLRLGAADYILKPINADALRASLGGIAERRRLEHARQRSEAAFRHLVEAAECLIVMLRGDRTICYFSPFAQEVTGYSADEVLGCGFRRLCGGDADHNSFEAQIDRALAGTPVRGVETVIHCRDGSERWLLWNARRLDEYDGQPAVLVIGQDITARKRAEERALQAERLAAIGEMMTGLAHESRNALQRSKACLEVLALEVEDRPEALDLVARIHKAQDHLHRLYEEVRSYAAPINLQRTSCDLRELWMETWANLSQAREGKEIRFSSHADTSDLRAQVDAFAIGQVLRNILENAIAACPHQGRITLWSADALLEGHPALRLSIRDNGPGLSAEQRRHIFDPFFTTKTRGTGLGMAIARRIVKAHGGQIAVGDGPHQGAEIVVTLPRK